VEGSRGSGFYGRSVAAKRVSFSLGEEEVRHKGNKGCSFIEEKREREEEEHRHKG